MGSWNTTPYINCPGPTKAAPPHPPSQARIPELERLKGELERRTSKMLKEEQRADKEKRAREGGWSRVKVVGGAG